MRIATVTHRRRPGPRQPFGSTAGGTPCRQRPLRPAGVGGDVDPGASSPTRAGPAAAAPRKVICCGLNYGDHIAETGRELPTPPHALRQVRRHADRPAAPTSCCPPGLEVDWEAELAVVVGAELRGATPRGGRGRHRRLHRRQRHLGARLAAPHAAVVPGQGVGRHHPDRPGRRHARRDRPGRRRRRDLPGQRRGAAARQHPHARLRLRRPAGLHLHVHRAAPRRPRPHRHARRRRHGA